MPGLLRKLLVFAAVDGLILQPHGNGSRENNNNNNTNGDYPLRIDYKTNKVTPLPNNHISEPSERERKDTGLEVYGLVGMSPAVPQQDAD